MTVGRRLKREISWQPSAAAHRFDGNLNRRENHCHRIPYGPPLLEIKEIVTKVWRESERERERERKTLKTSLDM